MSERCRRALEKLNLHGLSLLVEKGDSVLFTSREKQLKPLLQAISILGQAFRGATVTDKAVGGAAAKLLVYVSAGEVFTPLATKIGVKILQQAAIPLEAVKTVDHIVSDDGRPCKMEVLAELISNPKDYYIEVCKQLL